MHRALRPLIYATVLLAMSSLAVAHAADTPPPEPDDYWQGPMQSTVPATLKGATVIGTQQLENLIRTGKPVLIDVGPAPRRPPDPAVVWIPVPHKNIPQSIWIPGAGSGVVSAETASYFRKRLDDATGQDRSRALVIYCRANCWASWNAARRAIVEGYRSVYWYPAGVDTWQDAGLPTAIATAEGPNAQ